MKNFVRFMVSRAGRALRIITGLVLIAIGASFSSGVNWIFIIIGILPFATGLFDICVLSPLLGYSFSGKKTRQLISLGLLLLAGLSSPAQTCPGSLGTPIYINSLPYFATGLTTCGKGSSLDVHTNAQLCAEVWNYYGEDQTFIFTPTVTDSFAIILKANIPHATMILYAGCPFNGQGGTCVAFVGEGNSANPPFKGMLLQLTAGTTYYLVIDNSGLGGVLCIPSYDLSILTQPSNDDIGGAITLTPGSSCNPVSGNTYAASRTLPVPNACGGSVDDDVWYKFTATSTNHTVTATPIAPTSNIDLVLDVRDGGYGGTNIACSYLGDTYGVPEVIELTNLSIGHTYYVRVYTDDNTVEYRGYFNICVTTPAVAPPANNECSGAVSLTLGAAPVSGTTVGATQSIPAVSCNGTGNADDDVWYFITTAAPSFTVTASSATLDLVVDVRAPAGNCIGTNVDCINNTGAGGTESATVTAVNGVLTYYIRVYSVGATTGTFTISVATSGTPPACLAMPNAPTNGQTGLCPGSGVTLSWPVQAGATSYDLYFGTSATPPFAVNLAGTSYTTATVPAGTYYWQVRPKNANGTASGCAVWSFTVTDNTLPVITCPGLTTLAANASCQATLPAFAPVSVNDNCTASPTVTQLPAAGTMISGGAHTVTLRATDAAGNSGNCTLSVTLTDQIAPTITCPANATVAANAACQRVLQAYTPASVSDNCGAPAITQLPAAGATIGSGATTLILRATDAAGNSASCTFLVTVTDQTAPVVTCPANTTVTSNASCQAALAAYTPVSVNDNCTASPTVVQLPTAGTMISGGPTTVTLRATDVAGNSGSCTFSVILADQIAPTITCPGLATVAANAACQGTLPSYAPASVNDNCGAPTVLQIPASGTIIPAGASTVTLRATDAAGNSASCTFSVTVVDQTPPTIACPANATAIANASCQASLASYAPSSVGDNCSAPAVLQLPAAGATLSGGATTVTLRATDAAGNSTNCTFSVTVVDQTPPAITCPANTTVAANASCQAALGNYAAAATATDNCTASPMKTQLPAMGTTVGLGATTVTLRATDAAGNSATCAFNIVVTDQTAPLITCPANTTVAANASCSGAIGSYAAVSVSDNCSASPTVTQSPAAGTLLNGANAVLTVALTANDGNGNTAGCTFTVTLRDVTPPVAKCKNATVDLAANGTATVLSSTVNNASTDNCSFGLTVTPATFGCANIGANAVTLKATDTGGLTSTCTATVTIRDLTPPTALCKNINVYLDDAGQATITPAAVNNNSYDACGIATMTINNNQFDCSQIGGSPVVVQLALKDVNNNTSSCLANVYVKDNLPPTPECENTTVQLNSSGYVAVSSSELAAGSSDNCSVWSYNPTVKVYTTAHIGVNNLTITVKDYSNNAATCVAQVIVQPYGSGNMQHPEGGEARAHADETAALSGAEGLEVSVIPNPTAGASTVRFTLPEEQPYRLRLLDLNGRLIADRHFQGYTGENSLTLELDQLVPGIYLIDLQSAGTHGQQRVVVQR